MQQRELPTQGVTRELAAAPPGSPGEGGELSLQLGIQPNGQWVARLGFLAFGLGVCWLAAALKRVGARVALWLHMAFGVFMIATAAFSHRSWVPGALCIQRATHQGDFRHH